MLERRIRSNASAQAVSFCTVTSCSARSRVMNCGISEGGWQVPALEPSLSGRGGHLGYRSGTPDGQPDPASSGRHLLGQGTAAERREHVDYPKGCHLKGGPCARITLSG